MTDAQTDDAPRFHEHLYQVLFRDHPEPMWVCDRETGEVLDVNKAAARTYGYDRDEFIGRSIAELHPRETREEFLAFLDEPAGLPQPIEVLHTKQNGARLDVEIRCRRITFRGRPARLVQARDVTERNRAMEKMERLVGCDLLAAEPTRANGPGGGLDEAKREIQPIDELERALEEDEFRLYYHPLIDCDTGIRTGCEALIRWEHPEHGLLEPGGFLPVAEASGLIVQIGNWVLRKACEQIAEWNEARSRPLAVSVNVSVKQIRDANFLTSVREAMRDAGANPEWLQIELTEKTLMTKMDRAVELMDELRDTGVHVAIDDFGTGYSSLEYLLRLPVDILKIDRSFTEQITEEPYVVELFHMIRMMADRLDLDVIVEGVETYDILSRVMEQDFNQVQGFLFDRPMPPRRFEQQITGAGSIEPLEEV